ncbi:MAG: transcription-repair coupling factor [Alphaproteobacteria bacterium]|nr:transcription-repair coupling factor [Alphaproteobacteria bacterium]
MQQDFEHWADKTVTSVCDGYEAFVIADHVSAEKPLLYIASDGISLAQTAAMLRYIRPDLKVLEFPAWDTVPYDRVSPSSAVMAKRIDTLAQIVFHDGKTPLVVVTSIGAALQKLPPLKIFKNAVREIRVGAKLNFDAFLHYAAINGYTRVEQVMEAGEYAVRGDIIDIFPSGMENPLRIDLFDDEVERLRLFDVMSQRTIGELKSYCFQVAGEVVLDENTVRHFREKTREFFGADGMHDEIYEAVSEGRKYIGMENWLPLFYDDMLPTLFDYLPMATVIGGRNADEALKAKSEGIADYYAARAEAAQVKKGYGADEEIYRPLPPAMLYLSDAEILQILQRRKAISLTSMSLVQENNVSNSGCIPGRDFAHARHMNYTAVYQELKDYLVENGKRQRIICCYSEGSRERLLTLLKENDITDVLKAESWQEALQICQHKKIALIITELAHGFRTEKLCLISEQDILGARQRRQSKKVTSKDFIADVASLSVGELVVHIEHGIGRFMGLENITAGGAPHDCLKILFAHDDKLFVPVENIDVISRYGSDDEHVALDTLGGAAWQAKKAKVKEKIRDITEKLIKIAAERHLKTAANFVAPNGVYEEFCAKFPFSETDDQLHAIHDVLQDLNAGEPMDRLVCGDVGFGKTEVALRAAFTVAMSGSQVALIVPTTLLARQHYLNFSERMAGFPLKVRMLSRLSTAKEIKQTKEGLKDGSVDIVIGTHALLAKDIVFSDLGLLIVDEEQHFGVVHKERLKALKSDVHVLTLSATPIPRTLELSLTGVKQLSIIATPPVDRLAARTFVMPFDRVMTKEAIYREKFRNGQVFFVCPRVSDIPEMEKILHDLVPDVKIAVAHGQMPARQLEDIMEDFAARKYDLLLSTTIIESGIDMPSVNTMIIHRADMFGLAQLYQLRGRIGRSKVRGYCYFTVPPRKRLNPTAEKRLSILQALDSLGAGFSLASHDMDIRGSGNVLGTEQSGHIKDVGIALYQHMLEEEINRQKAVGLNDIAGVEQNTEWAPQITTGIPLMIPENYVCDLGVRLGLYRRIGALKTAEELLDMREELVDRFGALPPEVENLLQTIEIKQLCYKANIAKIDAGAKGILISFHNNTFAAADELIDLVTKSFGVLKIRPDQKLFYERDLSSYAVRTEMIKKVILKLIGLLEE